MNSDVLVALSVIVPLVCLGLLMTLSWPEDTLDDDSEECELSHPRRPILTMLDPTTEPTLAGAGPVVEQISPAMEAEVTPSVPTVDLGEFPEPMASPAG